MELASISLIVSLLFRCMYSDPKFSEYQFDQLYISFLVMEVKL